MKIIRSIQNRIYVVRDERVMLDFHLAYLYQVGTKALNEAVKRNSKRFPGDFMFRLRQEEWQAMRSQTVTASESASLQLQIVTASQHKRNIKATPYAFTKQGIAMLSGVINSEKTINMNIRRHDSFCGNKKNCIAEE